MAAGLPSDLSSDREADAGGVPVIRVHLLGAFDVSVAGQVVSENAWRQRKAAAVVKLLALDPANRLHRERLIDLLWPELDYDAGLNNLRQALYHARRELQRGGMPAGSVLRRDGEMVVLAAGDGVWVDVQAYERAARQAWRAPSPDSIRAAIDLYAGDLLPDDVYEEWTEPLRTTLRAGYLALLTRLGELHVERGQPDRAIDAWQRLVQAEQGLESAHRSLMRAYAETGQPEMALRQYDRLATILARDLDEHPEPATRELARAIAEGQIPVVISSSASSERAHPVMNLPSPVSSLVGRTREVAEVRQLLSTERLVTLTGPGGIGKTRLAIEAARGVTDDFPDGVAFIDLSSLADPELVIPAIAQALSVRETAGEALGATLVATVRDRNLLLVLDNFERVTGAGRDIASLLEQAPSLKALVTSRVRLRLRGEREYPVPPLANADDAEPGTVTDAVALFVERSRAVQPQFQLTDENAVTVDAICRRLAGLPLAIELAAARSRLLKPEAILNRLKRPLELLASGPLDLPARQQTIRATIQWSADLLDAGAQQFFTRLSAFAGGWTLEAAEAVAGDSSASPDALGYLEALVDQNLVTQLVQPDGEVRFGMLETIREFGLERLADSGEEEAIRDRHAAWVVRLAEQAEPNLEGTEQARWLARLEQEADNIRAALAWLREQGNAEPALRLVSVLRLTWFSRG
ncbi:MAG TPA: BTAD domain-containing putative transcriptional regulator, partial [Thermomicrobiales bacterium]|nr:BTAD domain-containing putative transcriptional regulator [Thermomicrobiales bacterium]